MSPHISSNPHFSEAQGNLPSCQAKKDLTMFNNSSMDTQNFTDTWIAKDPSLRRGFFTKADDYGLAAAFIFVAVTGVTLNLLTIIVVTVGKHTSREVKVQMVNLAVADMLSSLFIPAYASGYFLQISFPPYLALCAFVRIVGWGAFYTSPLWNVAISIERLVVVFFPLKASRYTRKHKYLVAGVVWVCGFAPELESVLHSKLRDFGGYLVCLSYPPLEANSPLTYEWLTTIKYLVPALVMIGAYTAIGIKLLTLRRVGEKTPSMRQAERKAKQVKIQVLKMLMIDALITLLTWLPYNLFISITNGFYDSFVATYTTREIFSMETVLFFLMLTNCFTSPLVYYTFNSSFKRDTKDLFTGMRRIRIGENWQTGRSSSHISNSSNSMQLQSSPSTKTIQMSMSIDSRKSIKY